MLRFAHPTIFMLFIVVLFLVIIYVIRNKTLERMLKKTLGEKMFPFFLSKVSHFKKNVKFIFSVLCISLMIFALARPQLGKGKQQITSQGVELIVAVDVSRSMLSEDV